MDIEVVTTKKKISKSIIKQLETATLGDMQHFISMKSNGYYVRDLGGKFADRVALFHGVNSWVIMDIRNWSTCGGLRVEAKAQKGFGVNVKTFQEEAIRDMWIELYNECKKLCMKNHLIL